MSASARWSARPLLWRVYLVGIAQIAVAAVAIFVAQHLLSHAPWQFDKQRHRGMLNSFAEFFDTPDQLERALAKLEGVSLTFYRLDGGIVASTRPPLPPLPQAELAQVLEGHIVSIPTTGPVAMTAATVERDGHVVGYGLALRRPTPQHAGAAAHPSAAPSAVRHMQDPFAPPPSTLPFVIAITLVGTAIISFLFARSLARPLAHLAKTARAFGSGDLAARAKLTRSDELGAVASTFDEMADQVDGLVRAQRELLANVSHELRTPLSRIRVALDIAAEGDLEAARQSLREIAQDWDDLDRLVEDVLSLVRFDLSSTANPSVGPLRKDHLDAHAVTDRAVATFRSTHPTRTIRLAIDEGPIPLEADGALLRRVLHNLLTNAVKYSDPGTTIELEVRGQKNVLEVSVKDKGIGIDAADIPRLFEPFFRSDRSRARKSGGVGLGLALARRIVEAHGGRIDVQSKVGEGTTVMFSIPTKSVA